MVNINNMSADEMNKRRHNTVIVNTFTGELIKWADGNPIEALREVYADAAILYKEMLHNFRQRATDIHRAQMENASKYRFIDMPLWLYVVSRYDIMAKAPVQEVMDIQYNGAFESLPPLQHVSKDGIESFCMGEPYSDGYYMQYASLTVKDELRYYRKLKKINDESTDIRKFLLV